MCLICDDFRMNCLTIPHGVRMECLKCGFVLYPVNSLPKRFSVNRDLSYIAWLKTRTSTFEKGGLHYYVR